MIKRKRMALVIAAVLGCTWGALGQVTYTVTIDTTERVGESAQIAFDFTSSDLNPNIVSIRELLTDGTLGLPITAGGLVEGDVILLHGDQGDDAALTTIKDSAFFNQLAMPITFGNQIVFKLEVTTQAGGTAPQDQLAFFILEANGKPAFPTSDPLGADALLTIDIDGMPGGSLQVFSPATRTNNDIAIKVPDLCPQDPNKSSPGVCGCGVADVDSDNDTKADCIDACPNDPAKSETGQCGCGNPETDTDGDTTPDCVDACPDDPAKFEVGQCGCGSPDVDTDGDGVADCVSAPPSQQCGSCGAGMAQAMSLTMFGLLAMQMRRRRAKS
jgi:hypothetical protein